MTVIADGGDKGIAYTTMRCLYCNKTYSGWANRIRVHLTGGDTSISKCDKAPEDEQHGIKGLCDAKHKQYAEKKRRGVLDKLRKPNAQVGS